MKLILFSVVLLLGCISVNGCGRNDGHYPSDEYDESLLLPVLNENDGYDALLAFHAPSMEPLCMDNLSNKIRGCDGYGCGHFRAPRGSRTHKGVDIECRSRDVWAPFPGRITRTARPYASGAHCINHGFVLRGSGQWEGYELKMFYVEVTPYLIGLTVTEGELIGTHTSLHCFYNSKMTDHIHIQLSKNGRIIDPTHFVLPQHMAF